MPQEPDEGGSENRARVTPPAERHADTGSDDRGLFPYNSVVGVIDDPSALEAAVQELVASGFAESDVHVLCGDGGIRRIDAKGKRKGLLARLFRIVDALGAEREHTARHVKELESGHFIVVWIRLTRGARRGPGTGWRPMAGILSTTTRGCRRRISLPRLRLTRRSCRGPRAS